MATDLCEGAGLVGEYVLDLAKLLVEGGGARSGRGAALLVVHVLVPVDQEALHEPNHLHTENNNHLWDENKVSVD